MSLNREKGYYGLFLFLSAAAFIVPLFVTINVLVRAPKPYLKPDINLDVSGVDNGVWDYLLKTYVENGLVDYEGFRRDYLLKTYISQLAVAEPQKLPDDSYRLALYCNAYNAFVIDGVITHKITDSVMNYKEDGKGFFDLTEHILNGKTISLNYLENILIRAAYHEPRVHMALVCAARSCPSLRPEAYMGGKYLEKQLEDQANLFANNPKYVYYDSKKQKLILSKIISWYGDDFNVVGGFRAFLAKRTKDPALKKALESESKPEFMEYDWTLNAQKNTTNVIDPSNHGNFGSGSVPNR